MKAKDLEHARSLLGDLNRLIETQEHAKNAYFSINYQPAEGRSLEPEHDLTKLVKSNPESLRDVLYEFVGAHISKLQADLAALGVETDL